MTDRTPPNSPDAQIAASGHEIAPHVSIAVMPPFVRLTRWLYKLAGSDLRGGYFYTETRGLQ